MVGSFGTGSTVVVVGLGTTGEAMARHLLSKGVEVIAIDDFPVAETGARAEELGIELISPSPAALNEMARSADLVVVSPGVPWSHPVFRAGANIVGELELAWREARAPIVAVTGTNGKTTVTTLITLMLDASGIRAVAAGNIGIPLIDVVGADVEVIVAEVSSFQLALTSSFHPRVAVLLNVSEDHLDWHPTIDHYVDSKARIWANQVPGDTMIANAEDPVVMRAVKLSAMDPITFGMTTGAYHVEDGCLVTPGGDMIIEGRSLQRALPHDLANGLAASAAALAAGGKLEGCRSVLASFAGLPHRVQLVGEAGGVSYYDDSKSTTPASVLAALSGFGLGSVVLIAGGRNKGLRLRDLRQEAARVKAVVAIGEAAEEVRNAFSGSCPVVIASSMGEAVTAAALTAEPGDTVLLSPGCSSFDWYSSYSERGEDFTEAVLAIKEKSSASRRSS